ncbi:hypothetical protein AcW2_006885 [Taiwanofungus camphoratus]|nr:hypothetical protein AcW2_006885 [Antrodia cinnamomea]
MAAKPHAAPQDNTGSSFLAQFPPPISLASPVLASVIPLPDQPLIAYSVFTGASATNTSDQLNLIEIARRRILKRNANHTILDSLLPSVYISKDLAALYVFAFCSTVWTSESHVALLALQFDGLVLTDSSTFTPATIYPCSITCSTQLTPCPNCLNLLRKPTNAPSSAHLLPRQPLRRPFHQFLQAVRGRLIDEIAEAAKGSSNCRPAVRLKDGFLLGPTSTSSEWGSGWEHHARSRPLIYCHLEVHLSHHSSQSSPARLIIHPVLRPTCYLPLYSNLPLPQRTPIILLPHGTPAYYMNTYGGPTSALTSQFDEALLGLGVGDWKGVSVHGSLESGFSTTSANGNTPTYVIAWLSVQNKQGEDKGMPVIWPVRLCLSYHASSPSIHARTSLQYIPELPAQLQASPPPPPPAVPPSLSGSKLGSSTSTEAGTRGATPLHQPIPQPADREHLLPSASRRLPTLTSSPTTISLRAFRTLSLSTKPYTRDVHKVAAEISGYVDAVAKERERERERIRREREGASSRGRACSTSGPGSVPMPPPPISRPSAPNRMNAEQVASPLSLPITNTTMVDQDIRSPFMPQDSTDSLFSPPETGATLPSNDDAMQISLDTKIEPQQSDLSAVPASLGPPDENDQNAVSTFDPFGGFEASWTQPSNEFVDINMDYDMGFNMNIDSFGGTRSRGDGVGGFDLDDGFDVFTDDDFNFFDAPVAQARSATTSTPSVTVVNPLNMGAGLMPTPGSAPLGLSPLPGVDSGPGPPTVTLTQPSPWTGPALGEGFTPRAIDFRYSDVPPAPDLLPPSPTKTQSSHSGPTTPTVHLSDYYEPSGGRKSDQLSLGPSIFDPIPFNISHRLADGKYAVGKFALPSPPDEEDRTEPVPLFSLFPLQSGWKSKYSAATDPRVGVVRKLIGVKRKSFDQGAREVKLSPSWVREHEEWESAPSPALDETKSEADSEDEERWPDEDDAATILRPSTPPPSYLPMGPSLLQTHFHHSHLLPLSAPLRHPGAVVSNSPGGTAPVSVPTPVSPAAVLGLTSEKLKSLEAAAQILVKEVVENSIWADAWQVNATTASLEVPAPTEVWQADVKRVNRLLGSVGMAQSPVSLQMLSGLDSAQRESGEDASITSLHLLESPMFTVGKSDTLIQVLPTALRFWEKLGLGPRGGKKDVTAFVFFEGSDEEKQMEIAEWLNKVSSAYSAKNFGAHSAGMCTSCTRPGLVPIRFDSFRKTLASFVAGLAQPSLSFVFYIVTPPSIIALTSPILRHLFSAVKRVTKAHGDMQILFHFVPDALITGGPTDPRAGHVGLEPFVESLAPQRGYFRAPAFALARPLVSTGVAQYPFPDHGARVTFVLEPHLNSLDVVDRHTLLHVGYQTTPCGRWVLAACVDARGEAYELGAWLLPGESVETFVVNQVWGFVRDFAARANVEWKIVVAKLGSLRSSELDAWITHFDSTACSMETPPMHITLLSVEHENPWIFLAQATNNGTNGKCALSPIPSSTRSPPRTGSGTVLADTSYSTYALFSCAGIACIPSLSSFSSSGPFNPGHTDLSFIPDSEDEEPQLQSHPSVRALGSNTLIYVPSGTDHTSISVVRIHRLHTTCSLRSSLLTRSPVEALPSRMQGIDATEDKTLQDITQNFHDLFVLSRMRWRMRQHSTLPFHLAALEIMRMALCKESTD